MDHFRLQDRYADRTTISRGIRTHRDWRLKQYDTTVDVSPIPQESYSAGEAMALEALPRPACTQDRPGVGVLIRHAGKTHYYLVLAWWDRQNELITRVFVREAGAGAGGAGGAVWRDGAGAYSFCVWDLQVFWNEREAYVRNVLSGAGRDGVEAYLADFGGIGAAR